MDFEPDFELDAFFQSCGPLGAHTSISVEQKCLGEFIEYKDAEQALRDWIKENCVWRNIWSVSDHGNIEQITDFDFGDAGVEPCCSDPLCSCNNYSI